MKVISSLLSLAAVATIVPTAVDAARADTCEDQSKCIDFEITTLGADACGVGGNCTVEVCMRIQAGSSNNFGTCPKDVGGGGFSHVCSQTDAGGCPNWGDQAETIPLLGQSDGTDCTLTGHGSGAPAFGDKCSGEDTIVMCQEGAPGATLYWIIKDGQDTEQEDPQTLYPFIWHDTHQCGAEVKCFNYVYKCGDGKSDTQTKKERTWTFKIPDSDGSDCDPCTFYPPTPTPPSPTPPITPEPPIVSPPPSPTPVAPVAPTPTINTVPSPSGGNGDPHFKTWKNEHYEYHGQCDMVMTKDANFADGLGLDIQIRTKLVRFWSYIRNASIRIGSDIIELEGSSDSEDQSIRYWYNMEFQAENANTLGGFPMTIRRIYSMMTKIEIDLNSMYPGVTIEMSTYKEFIKVEVKGATEEAFGNAVGLLGDFKTGKTLARDGVTELHDWNEFGNEWQITPTDDMLFHSTVDPQFPERCIVPEDPRGDRRRRLGESNITMEQAEKACSGLKDSLDRKDCVYDILATQDMGMAGAF
ncbi:unnamed protein product [Cylindrotheca closterium]|uniref:VWFD domain-containing protein n=1 Tax=Cylindrotheca closterium TaxID=2856 RepID=A0AAD2GBY1_9STRA|nr:unnamed protein product [Cylindrotheca closterium]